MLCQICKAENPEDATVCVACGSTPTLAPGATVSGGAIPMGPAKLAGQVIAGRYEIKSILGKGGMGVVYRASDRMLGEDVAIKLLHGTASGETTEVERLKREIQTARKITHPNVIRIHDMGVDGEDGFLAMEILVGGSLNRRLASGRPPVDEAVQIAIGICDGLAAAHAKGIIHRDLKPHNVLFDADGAPKLVDFGLARLAEATSHTMGFSGTPLYMSPEMTDGREITPRSDVYSLGVVLYELFCGRTPFRADTLLRLAMMHAKEAPPRPTSIRPDLPEPIEKILLKCLQKEPADRFANAKEVGDALRAFQAGSPTVITLRIPEPTAEQLPAAPAPPKKRKTAAQRFAYLAGVGSAFAAAFLVLFHNHLSLRYGDRTQGNGQKVASLELDSVRGGGPAAKPVVDVPVKVEQGFADKDAAVGDKPAITPVPAATRKGSHVAHATPTPVRVTVANTAPSPTPVATTAVVASAVPPAVLTLRAEPIWGTVFLDGVKIGTTSSRDLKERSTPSGSHSIEITPPPGSSYAPYTSTIVLHPGETACYRVNFDTKRLERCDL